MSENDRERPGRIFRWIMVGVVILIAVWFAASLISFVTSPTQSSYYPMQGFRPFFPFGWLFGFFVIFIIIGALRWLFWPWGYMHRRRYWRYRDESYYILRERYARGEITKEQYDQMMQDLQKQLPGPR